MAGEPGLQHERTALAWQRTGVSASAGSAVGLLAAAHDGSGRLLVLVAVLSAAGAGCVALAAGSHASPGHATSPWTRLLATVGATLALAVTGTTLAVVALVVRT
ncbi:MAG: DUF202 domain-containing protein [Actinobacteria bacterium]|nr:DUF202 domain-containing protein [Actinomycetota bacterium]